MTLSPCPVSLMPGTVIHKFGATGNRNSQREKYPSTPGMIQITPEAGFFHYEKELHGPFPEAPWIRKSRTEK